MPVVQHAATATVVNIAVQEEPAVYVQAGRRNQKPVTVHQKKVKAIAANAVPQPRKGQGAAGRREVVGIAGSMGGDELTVDS